jgi:hypothetical protein
MPAKVAYALAKNIKVVDDELKIFDETRIKLLGENWTLNSETGKYDIPLEEQEKWDSMYIDLVNSEIDVKIYQIDLTSMDGVELTPVEVLTISWMIKDLS